MSERSAPTEISPGVAQGCCCCCCCRRQGGVRGDIVGPLPTVGGCDRYPTSDIHFFEMAISDVAEDYPERTQRPRRFVPLAEAVALCRWPELARILRDLAQQRGA